MSTRHETRDRYDAVRGFTEELSAPLQIEDHVVQTAWFVSPTKWHLAHTSWFFETFILRPYLSGYAEFHPEYNFLFNSYYNAVGDQHPQASRGMLSRPGVSQIREFRAHVDEAIHRCIEQVDEAQWPEVQRLFEVGFHHEQQHQELLLTDIKHVFANNPLKPAYNPEIAAAIGGAAPDDLQWITFDEGVREIGWEGDGFCFDNEQPRHKTYVQDFALADRLITNREYVAFIEDGGYDTVGLWLSDGWGEVNERGWAAPLYWTERDGAWHQMTLGGERPLDLDEPVTHLSYYEADAFARWYGARLPTEAEWETACAQAAPAEQGTFAEDRRFHPAPDAGEGRLRQMLGDVWEWTASPYVAYPGWTAPEGALGEYNGKFMCNTIVLRGGSCATSRSHIRPTYRNFFAPETRWQFSGVRLAKDHT